MKKAYGKKGELKDISKDYDAFFPIYSEEEGKRFCSLVKRKFSLPKYFDDEILVGIEMKDFVNTLCERMGWKQLKLVQYEVFFELSIEFYTTLKIVDENLGLFSCRLFGKEYKFHYELISEIFCFSHGGICQPPPEFNMHKFWSEITGGDKLCDDQVMISGLIQSHACLLMHKFMAHTIFGKKDSTKVSHDELFLMWCMHTNTKVNSAYFVFRSMWRVVQARKALISMGHIVTGLAMFFLPQEIEKYELELLEREMLDEDYLTRAEIINEWGELEDAKSRRCYVFRQHSLKLGEVPLPRVVEEYEDVSEDQEELALQEERMRKRKRADERGEQIIREIKERINLSEHRIGNLIVDVSSELEDFERRSEARMEELMSQIKELKQQISQKKVTERSMESPIEFTLPFTSPTSTTK